MMDRAAFSFLHARRMPEAASNKQRYGWRPADEAYFVKWIVTQPFFQIVRTCLSRWPL
ncbi:hypothetical protein AB7M37_001274 [Sinorhizobium fredii]